MIGGTINENMEKSSDSFRAVLSVWLLYLRRRMEHCSPDAETVCGKGKNNYQSGTSGYHQRGAQSAGNYDRQRGHAVRIPGGRSCLRNHLRYRHDHTAHGRFITDHIFLHPFQRK